MEKKVKNSNTKSATKQIKFCDVMSDVDKIWYDKAYKRFSIVLKRDKYPDPMSHKKWFI
jgi:hypothetical protein